MPDTPTEEWAYHSRVSESSMFLPNLGQSANGGVSGPAGV